MRSLRAVIAPALLLLWLDGGFTFSSFSFVPSNIAVHRAKHTTARPPLSPLSSRSSSSDNADYNADLAQKKQEAAESFIQYNDGTWSGRAVIFSIPQTLSNEKSRADSISHASYTLTSSTDITSSGISQKSTLQWSSTSLSSFSRYTTLLSGNTGFDVDSVDGSYSADHSLLDLNLPSTNLLGSFAIETSIAVTDSRRIRSILLYNFSKSLSRIILFDESKKDTPTTSSSTTTLQQEITNTILNLGEDGNTDRMKKIQAAASLGAQKAQLEAKSIAEDSNDRVKVSTFQPNLRRLCSGVWEGDGVLRNHNSPIPLKNKGFGKSQPKIMEAGSGLKDGFAEWFVNVFKMCLTYSWDGGEKIRQECTLNPGIGSRDSGNLIVGWGELIEDGVRVDVGRGTKFEDKESLIVSTFDQGQSISIMLGCVQIKGSLSLKSNENENEENNDVNPFISELSVFQKREIAAEVNEGIEVGEEKVEYFLSRLSRLYDNNGRLKSGSSAFFTLNKFFN